MSIVKFHYEIARPKNSQKISRVSESSSKHANKNSKLEECQNQLWNELDYSSMRTKMKKEITMASVRKKNKIFLRKR